MNRRDEALARLERLRPALRRGVVASERHSDVLRRFGNVTLHQLTALRLLVSGGPLTMNELAAQMEVSPSAATQLVDRLVQQDLVQRARDPADRRLIRVGISASAAVTVREFEADTSRRLAELLRPLGEEELEQLAALVERIASPLTRPDGSGPTTHSRGGPS